CSQCENGYQNNGTSCRDIRENTCDTYSGTTCTKCTSENLLVDGECISMASLKCQATDDGKTCKTCNPDYHNEGGTCAKGYVENCSVYDGEKCQTCNSSSLVVSVNNSCVAGKKFSDLNAYKMGDYYAAPIGWSGWQSDYVLTENGEFDWVATAEKYCQSKGMVLPSYEQLDNIFANKTSDFDTVGDGWIWTTDILSGWNRGTFNTSTGQHNNDGKTVCYSSLKQGISDTGYKYGCKPEHILEGATPSSHGVMCVSPVNN
ncbi:hypothetical protein IJ732_07310, partial [bacterium]|nr:hypothetical protein [bacterium]